MKSGKYLDHEMNEIPLLNLKLYEDYFVKDYNGQCASFVKHINHYDDLLKLKNITHGEYIFQDAVHQSAFMNSINPMALNTLRIVTINKDGNPYVFSAILRVGTSKTENVDNWAAGGLAIGIDENGSLRKFGFYKPQYGTKTDRHPDTGVIFEGLHIEGYQEACEAACKAHRFFYGVHSIGWDIALTAEGPVFIEGNDNWEISLMQACNGGLKDKWYEALK